MKNSVPSNIFREYDIRGIYNKDLTDSLAYLIGKAFVSKATKKRGVFPSKIIVGYDARVSSLALKKSLVAGINSCGVGVIDIGLCPTPLQYFSMYSLDIPDGIMITGSHNPPEFNGFKMSVDKQTIYGQDIKDIQTLIENNDFICLVGKPKVETYNVINSYLDFIEKHFSPLKGLRVVIDSGNGTAGLVAPIAFRRLGAEVIELYSEPNGFFPNHHPDPVVEENLKDLKREVIKNKAHFGIGFDGDADRLGVVDEKGNTIWSDKLAIVFIRDLLSKHKGAKIIGEVKCSSVMYEEIEKLGGIPIMWKTGHSLIKNKMKEEGAIFAAEMSGHMFFADRYFGYDDAIYASLRLAEIVNKNKVPLSKLLEGIKPVYSSPEIKIPCPDEQKFHIVNEFKSYFELYDCCTIDGVRIKFPNGWALLRASNTQPALVLRFEAKSKQDYVQIQKMVYEKLSQCSIKNSNITPSELVCAES